MLDAAFSQITIVGTGLLGGSLGLALRRGGYGGRIVGVGRRAVTLDKAIAHGCIDAGTTDLAEACDGAAIVVLAVPVGTSLDLLRQMATLELGRTIITDVGSTKASVVAEAERLLPAPGRFVGSHPMAGSEQSGPDAARADLYDHRPCIITPTDATNADALATIDQLWQALGMRVTRMDPTRHDQVVALISHLPHAVSVLLMNLAEQSDGLGVASTGLADMTRLAGGDVQMWADIFSDNAPAVLDAMEQWRPLFDGFAEMLRRGDRDELAAMLEQTRQMRNRWLAGRQERD